MKAQKKNAQIKIEPELAVKLIQQLHGLSIADAKAALNRAIELLDITQLVSAKSRFIG